jgi:hypothetical protein
VMINKNKSATTNDSQRIRRRVSCRTTGYSIVPSWLMPFRTTLFCSSDCCAYWRFGMIESASSCTLTVTIAMK